MSGPGSVKVVTEPSVYVIARQAVDEAEMSRFLADNGSPDWTTDASSAGERVVEFSGRLCYQSFSRPRPGGNSAYVRHILEAAHGSVTEHAVLTILLTGVSRSLTHELIRQRVGLSPSQLSQRFVDESDVAFVVPPLLCRLAEVYRENGSTTDQYRDLWPQGACRLFQGWLNDVGQARDAYRRLAESFDESPKYFDLPADKTARRKAIREAARSVLPNCTETKIVLTGNARAWRWLCEQRGSEQADAEFRRLALKLHGVLLKEAPALFGDYEVRDGGNGPYLHTDHRKV